MAGRQSYSSIQMSISLPNRGASSTRVGSYRCMNRCRHAERISPKIRSRGSSRESDSLNSLRAPGNIGIDRFFPAKLWNGGFAPVDIASLVFFRIGFGLLMLRMVQLVWSLDRISQWWLEPSFLFKYPGFSWVQPWPGNGLYIHWIFLGVFALFLTVGFLYRISAALFFLSHSYFFLLDQGRYVNHTYLICLFSFLLIFAPAHRAFSVDALFRPKLRSQTAPAWSLWLLRAQMGVVYFFAGGANIAPDWLHGEPLRTWLKQQVRYPLLDRVVQHEWVVHATSFG